MKRKENLKLSQYNTKKIEASTMLLLMTSLYITGVRLILHSAYDKRNFYSDITQLNKNLIAENYCIVLKC